MKFILLFLLVVQLDAAQPGFAPGELLVKFKAPFRSNAKQDPADALHARLGASRLDRLWAIGVDRVKLPAGAEVAEMALQYQADASVEKAEPNFYFRRYAPMDAAYVAGLQDWYDRIGATPAFNSHFSGSPAFSLGAQVTVAVLDTGVAAHPQIAAALLPGVSLVAAEPSTTDLNGHGTFVSGIIASQVSPTAADPGIAGVFFDQAKVRIQSVKVLDQNGDGLLSEIAQGIIWAADQGIKVMNMSLGSIADSETMESAVNYARGRGAFIVAASGNDDSAVGYPAAYPNVFSVGALGAADARACYSNYGRVDLSAPGGEAGGACSPLSCACAGVAAGCAQQIWSTCRTASNYSAGIGTSFAAPMVAAAAALLLSQDPSRGPADLHRILIQTADPLGGGYNIYTGWGRLNVHKALTYGTGPASLPGASLKIYNWPNPFRPDREGLTQLTFILESPADAKIRILDMGGDLVYEKSLARAQTFAGMNMVTWDGRNGAGLTVANGAYFVVLEAGGQVAKNRVVVLQ